MKPEKVISWGEVAKHNTDESVWIVINDGVYDVTSYLEEHPGGPIVLTSKAGQDASVAFEQAAHSANAKDNVMPKYRIGSIDRDSAMEDWQKQAVQSTPNILITVGIMALILITIYFLAA